MVVFGKWFSSGKVVVIGISGFIWEGASIRAKCFFSGKVVVFG